MTIIRRTPLLLLLIPFVLSCNSAFIPTAVVYKDYRITPALAQDSALAAQLQPYRDSVSQSMNAVVGYADVSLDKKQPEGTLGNFMADAMLYAAKKQFSQPVDVAFVNYGGMRINQLAAGAVTRGKVFELMPFDNLVVLQQLKGDMLQQFLDHIAARGGWPVSGLTMQIKDKKAVNVLISGQPLEAGKTYTIANSDYVANGGDDAAMLKTIPQQNQGYLMRDAIFDYIAALKTQGKNISAIQENRISYAQ